LAYEKTRVNLDSDVKTCVHVFQIFHQLIQQDKLEHQDQAVNFGIGQTISIAVRRNYLYEDAFEKLSPDNGLSSLAVDWFHQNCGKTNWNRSPVCVSFMLV